MDIRTEIYNTLQTAKTSREKKKESDQLIAECLFLGVCPKCGEDLDTYETKTYENPLYKFDIPQHDTSKKKEAKCKLCDWATEQYLPIEERNE